MARTASTHSPGSSLSEEEFKDTLVMKNDNNTSVDSGQNTKKRKTTAPTKGAKKAKVDKNEEGMSKTTEREIEDEQHTDDSTESAANPKGQAPTKGKKETNRKPKGQAVEQGPLAERTKDSKLRMGAHVSTAGGVHNAIVNAMHIGANAFALFLKSQRKWENKALSEEHTTLFLDACNKQGFQQGDCCLPHGSYLVNLAHPDEDRKKQAYGSFHDDLTRCHALGIRYFNFHPGTSNATTRENGIRLIAEAINKAHKDPATGKVIPVLETMAASGNTIGSTFQDIAEIIQFVENKDRIGVCLDTCHVFAAGYDIRTKEGYTATMEEFDDIIGLKYLKALHMNDSKAHFDSHRDLHANIGTGFLGLKAFHHIVNDSRLHGLPMILETPVDTKDEKLAKIGEDRSIWAREIKLLESLVGMDIESDEFKSLEAERSAWPQGVWERAAIDKQVADKAKKNKKAAKGKKKKKNAKVEDDEETDAE